MTGVPDDRYGEVAWAFVVPADDAGLDARVLVTHCREHLASFKVPRGVTFLSAEDLPTTATGKVQKFRLEARDQSRR